MVKRDSEFWETALDRLQKDPGLTVTKLAMELGIPYTSLYHNVYKLNGKNGVRKNIYRGSNFWKTALDRLQDDPDLTITQLAEELNISYGSLYSKVYKLKGKIKCRGFEYWETAFDRLQKDPFLTMTQLANDLNISYTTLNNGLAKYKKTKIETENQKPFPPIDLRESQKIIELLLKSVYVQEQVVEELKKIRSVLENK
jgi:DNA-binding Lrp family transcriptional regulator